MIDLERSLKKVSLTIKREQSLDFLFFKLVMGSAKEVSEAKPMSLFQPSSDRQRVNELILTS